MAKKNDVVHVEIITDILTWIDINICVPLKINDVAEKAGYSKWHFQRIFHRVTQRTLANYIRDRKLELAAWDLSNTNDDISYISYKYGFDSQQSFTRTFSRKYNIPPSAYRKYNLSRSIPEEISI
ncbi:helix-turn-helix domain-containing protein [Kluyvera sp. STS39-E]|uniref:helix-turn-helix domain-containing protein n=1 Tax=Enterobacteriaceae TaxID=543 RepID=UPI000E3C3991|nr:MULTISPECIES: helix-turn-helix domain-containing protein [Citrobacter]MBD0826602.1 helix-turn-helix domain-containing protein [Citrobacter sp. C1]RFU93325.1 helix-turn-helix domain-containing protein [Citrobacter gillenii]